MKGNMFKQMAILVLLIFFLIFLGCGKDKIDSGPNADAQGHTSPSKATILSNTEFGKELAFNDQQNFENAQRGFIARDPNLSIKNARGEFIWNQPGYGFMQGNAPASVNPSLWRQGQLNNIHGLFKVTEGIYQLRGHDLANMTLIQGNTGWIIVDPLTAEETASKALGLARKHLGDAPILAIIYTHSHIDHFGGVLGIMSEENAKLKKVRIIAPKGFMEEATSENIIAGVAMARRSMFMYGKNLARSERGHVGSGLGKLSSYQRTALMEAGETQCHL